MKNTLKLIAILCLYTLLTLPYLTTFPPINNLGDESWMVNISFELLKSGRPIATMFPHTPVGEQVQVTTTWIYNGILSAFLYVFGTDIWVGRLLSLLCGFLVLFLTYRFGKDIAGPKVGLTASLLLATSLAFSWHSREARPEMMFMLFVTLSVYFLYRGWTGKNNNFLFLSGLISTISWQVHPNGIIFSLSLLIIYLGLYISSLLSKSSAMFLSGLFIGFGLWLTYNFIPYSLSSFLTVHKKYIPPVFRENFLGLFGQGFLSVLDFFSIKHLNLLAFLYHSSESIYFIYFILIIVFTGFLLDKNKKSFGFLLSFLIATLFIRNFITGAWNWFHHSAFFPLFSIVLAIAIFNIPDRIPWERFKRVFAAIIIITITTLGAWDIMKNNIDMMKYDYNSFMNRVSSNVPEGVAVLGASLFYPTFANRDNRFVGYLFMEKRCPDFADEIKALEVDYILLEHNMHEEVSRVWCSEEYYQEQIIGFLEENATLVTVIEANYPSRYKVMESVYLFKVNQKLN